MKIAKGLKTVKIVDEYKVFNDYGKSVNHVSIYVITKLEETKVGFAISFRTYSETFENGGFGTTLWVKNASIEKAEMFLTSPSKAKQVASLIGAEIAGYETNNKLK